MKNQYFGDVNDFKKYGLLRSIIDVTGLRILVVWMLTPDDGGPDGRLTEYLDKPGTYRGCDPELFDGLKGLLSNNSPRAVSSIEQVGLVPMATYFSEITPDASGLRRQWFGSLKKQAGNAQMVFLDPDNGLEVKSKPYGRKLSSKYLYWREVEELWSEGKSLLIYQHFIREKRLKFVEMMLDDLSRAAPGARVEAFSTAHVVFLMALQPEHHQFHSQVVNNIGVTWGGIIWARGAA